MAAHPPAHKARAAQESCANPARGAFWGGEDRLMDEPCQNDLRTRYRDRLRAALMDLDHQSEGTRDSRKVVTLDQQSVGRLSRMDAMQGQAMAAATEARRRGRATAIRAALARMEAGEFGWCDSCGGFIGWKRLDLDPAVMRCIGCAR